MPKGEDRGVTLGANRSRQGRDVASVDRLSDQELATALALRLVQKEGKSMTLRKIRYSHYAMQIAAAVLLGVCCLQPAIAQTADAEAAARESWGAFMSQYTQPEEGCFQATYPNLFWEKVECKVVTHPFVHPRFHKPGGALTAGNGNDYVAEAAGLISSTLGSFPTVKGVTSEKSVGVAEYGDGGILGANEYSIQLNTQFTSTSAACASHSGCTVWQQFIYATDYETKGSAAVFMQYWLIGWGKSACPKGFGSDGVLNLPEPQA